MGKRLAMALLNVGFIAFAACFTPAMADEDGQFYIEIGKDVPQDEAAQEWQALVSTHKSLLGKLRMYPKSVIEGGNVAHARMQAGPLDDKARAQKICNRLFRDDVPCFVIEGLETAPPTSMMTISEKAGESVRIVQMPWDPASDVPPPPPIADGAPAPTTSAPVALPWLTQPDQPQQAQITISEDSMASSAPVQAEDIQSSGPAPDTIQEQTSVQQVVTTSGTREAEVQVAEAIRVPLSSGEGESGNAKVIVKSLPAPDTSFRIAQPENGQLPEGSVAGWVSIGPFLNAEIATAFWDETRTAERDRTRGLRVRVQRPLMEGSAKVNLSVGPFASSEDASNFCRDAIQANDKGLTCNFANPDAVVQGGSERSLLQMARRRPVENPLSELPAPKQYWVQVISTPNQVDALGQWETIKNMHPDLLKGMRAGISSSPTDSNNFVVRVGPLKANEDAQKLCSDFSERGVSCRVVLYSQGR